MRTDLKILMTPAGMIANFIVIILLLFYPLHGEKLVKMIFEMMYLCSFSGSSNKPKALTTEHVRL